MGRVVVPLSRCDWKSEGQHAIMIIVFLIDQRCSQQRWYDVNARVALLPGRCYICSPGAWPASTSPEPLPLPACFQVGEVSPLFPQLYFVTDDLGSFWPWDALEAPYASYSAKHVRMRGLVFSVRLSSIFLCAALSQAS